MLTNSFKATIGAIVVVGIAGGLAVTQYNQEQQIKALQTPPAIVVITPTVVPVTATPSATLTPVKKVVVPVRVSTVAPVVTKAVVK